MVGTGGCGVRYGNHGNEGDDGASRTSRHSLRLICSDVRLRGPGPSARCDVVWCGVGGYVWSAGDVQDVTC